MNSEGFPERCNHHKYNSTNHTIDYCKTTIFPHATLSLCYTVLWTACEILHAFLLSELTICKNCNSRTHLTLNFRTFHRLPRTLVRFKDFPGTKIYGFKFLHFPGSAWTPFPVSLSIQKLRKLTGMLISHLAKINNVTQYVKKLDKNSLYIA